MKTQYVLGIIFGTIFFLSDILYPGIFIISEVYPLALLTFLVKYTCELGSADICWDRLWYFNAITQKS